MRGWMDLDQVAALERKKSGWIHKYAVKSICESGATDRDGKMRKDQCVLSEAGRFKRWDWTW